MSCETLPLRFSSDGDEETSVLALVRPRGSQDSIHAPFLAEEAYPLILRALLNTHLDTDDNDDEHRICLSEDNILRIAGAASTALFGTKDDVFARFLVVPRVECAISVLLWRVRVSSTCADGQTGVELPSVPVRVLASSLAGLLDNTKLYASGKHSTFPSPGTPLQKTKPVPPPIHHLSLDHHLAPPTPLTATRTYSDPCLSPTQPHARPPRLSLSRPMTPPDSATMETTPISDATLTPTADTFLTPASAKRMVFPRVKFKPPPIITRTTPSRVSRHVQSASAVTLTFAAAGLSGCEIEPLAFKPMTKDPTNELEPEKVVEEDVTQPQPATPTLPEPPKETKPKPTRAPSPNPPRAPSPSKRVLRKAPPTKVGRSKSQVRSSSPTKQSLWTPSPAEAHFRSPSPTRLALPLRTRSVLGMGSTTSAATSVESSPVVSRSMDLPSSSTSSPALVSRSKLREPSPMMRTRTPSPAPPSPVAEAPPSRSPSPQPEVRSPSPAQSMPGSSLRSPSSNLLRSPGPSMFEGSSTGFGSPGSMVKSGGGSGAGTSGNGDQTPVTPTPRRTWSGVKFEGIDGSPSPSRKALSPSPSGNGLAALLNRSALSPSPNALRTRANLGASPGATSLSTVPSLSPFPESDSEFEFGAKGEGEEEDVTLTGRTRGVLGLMGARVGTPTRAAAGTPTRNHTAPTNLNASPSRGSTTTRRSYTLGVPMTQVTSAGRGTPGGVSESEAESLPFPGSQSTLSLPGDISLPELVSPFTTPIELPSSSSESSPSPWRRQLGTTTESEIDLLIPLAATENLSRSDVMRLMGRSGSYDSPFGGSSGGDSPVPVPAGLPTHSHIAPGVRAHQAPVPVFMTPGGAPGSAVRAAAGGGTRRPLPQPPTLSSSSESSNPSPLLPHPTPSHSRVASETSVESGVSGIVEYIEEVDEAMVRTTEIGVGAGRARVLTGVGVGRARGASVVGKTRERVDSVKSKVDSGLSRSESTNTARPRVDSIRTRVDSVTRPRVNSAVRSRVDSGFRRKAGSSESPSTDSPVTPASASRPPSSASTWRTVGRKPSSEAMGRRTPIGRKASSTSMRKSSTSSLRSTTTTATRTLPNTVSSSKKSARTISISSGTSTPRSGASTPRSRTMSNGGKDTVSGLPTPKQGTPRVSMSTPRTSLSSGRGNVTSPRASMSTPRTSTASPRTSTASPRTSIASPRTSTNSPRAVATPSKDVPVPKSALKHSKVPPARPQRSSLRPGPRTSVLAASAPVVPTQAALPVTPMVTHTHASAPVSPPRTRATSLDTSPSKAHLKESPRPRRTSSVSTKPPPLSRSSVSAPAPTTLAPPPIRARASSRTASSENADSGAVPFPIPESASEGEGGLKVPDTRTVKRTLSVGSAARRLVNRARGGSPVPSMPTDSVSIAPSTVAHSVGDSLADKSQDKAPKPPRSLSRLAFAALLPRRNVSNGAAEAKAALAQAKAREVAEAKAKAKATIEEAKARARVEAEEAKAARAAEKEKAAREKEPKRLVRRFGSMSKKSGVQAA